MLHYTVETDQSVEEAVSSLEASLQEEKSGVLWHFDIKETLESKGLEFDQPYRVLEVCNPKEAKEVLEENQMVGYFLPCKMVVYDDGGTTKVGLPRPTALIEMVNDDALKQFAKDIEDRLITCMDRAA